MALTIEEVYLLLRDETRKRETLQTRVDVLEDFIQKQFPGMFAGEVGTVNDPDIKTVEIPLGALVGELPQTETGLVPLEEKDGSTE